MMKVLGSWTFITLLETFVAVLKSDPRRSFELDGASNDLAMVPDFIISRYKRNGSLYEVVLRYGIGPDDNGWRGSIHRLFYYPWRPETIHKYAEEMATAFVRGSDLTDDYRTKHPDTELDDDEPPPHPYSCKPGIELTWIDPLDPSSGQTASRSSLPPAIQKPTVTAFPIEANPVLPKDIED